MNKNDLNGITVLMTGATGFIGQSISKQLIESGAEVFAITHKQKPKNNQIKSVFYKENFISLYEPLKEIKIDIVIHLATFFVPNHTPEQIDNLIDSNIKLGCYLLELVKQMKVPYFINTATYTQHYGNEGYNPQNLYSATKQSFESIQKYYEEVTKTLFVTLELQDTYGPNDERPKFLNQLIAALRKNETFNMSFGEQEIGYLFIDDVVNAYIHTINLMINQEIINNSKFSLFPVEILKLKDVVSIASSTINSSITINRGFYPYKNREMMTFRPKFLNLPGWKAEVKITDGILKML